MPLRSSENMKPDLPTAEAEHNATCVRKLSRRPPAGDREASADRRVDAIDVSPACADEKRCRPDPFLKPPMVAPALMPPIDSGY